MNRRELLKNSIRISAAGYVAPMILGNASAAAAAVVSAIPCGATGCGTSCGGSLGCHCMPTVEGSACMQETCLGLFQVCAASSDCEPGWACALAICCQLTLQTGNGNGGFHACVPLCGTAQ